MVAPVEAVRIVVPRRWWDQVVAQVVRPTTGVASFAWPLSAEGHRLLARARFSTGGDGHLVLIAPGAASAPYADDPTGWRVEIVLGRDGDGQGTLQASARSPEGRVLPVATLDLPGREQRVIHFGLPAPTPAGDEERLAEVQWSRTRGALGDAVWRRLYTASVVVVGCGRTGTLAAEALGALGVRQLTLIDPDAVELHNLGESALFQAGDLGRPKSEAARDALVLRHEGPDVRAITGSGGGWEALTAIRDAALVVACPDSDAARSAVGALASRYHRPLLDIGTAVRRADQGGGMGFDVRLILPGDGCVRCFGDGEDQAEGEEHASQDGDAWRHRRAGSLRSLNTVAVGLGLRLVEDLWIGRVRRSRHVQATWDDHGELSVEQRERETLLVGHDCLCHLIGIPVGLA